MKLKINQQSNTIIDFEGSNCYHNQENQIKIPSFVNKVSVKSEYLSGNQVFFLPSGHPRGCSQEHPLLYRQTL